MTNSITVTPSSSSNQSMTSQLPISNASTSIVRKISNSGDFANDLGFANSSVGSDVSVLVC